MKGGTLQINRSAGISFWQAPESFRVEHFETYLHDLVSDPGYSVGFQEVMDFSKVETCELSAEGVAQMVFCQRAFKDKLIGNQRVMIAPGDYINVLCRMYSLRSADVPMEIEVFHNAEEAAMWLGNRLMTALRLST